MTNLADKKFEILWKVNYGSLECKNGVQSIEETEKTEGEGSLFGGTRYDQVVDFFELLSLTHYSGVYSFVMSEFTPFELSEKIEKEDIEEYLESIYDDETVKFYECKALTYDGTPYMVYYPLTEDMEEVSNETFKIMKQYLDFTGEVIERKGTL